MKVSKLEELKAQPAPPVVWILALTQDGCSRIVWRERGDLLPGP